MKGAAQYMGVVALMALAIPFVASAQFSSTLSNLFYLTVGAAVLLAVIVIAYGGIIYMASDAITQKSDAREWITSALIGLLIVLGSTLLLSIINPAILNFEIDFTRGAPTGGSVTTPSSPSSSGRSPDLIAGTDIKELADNLDCRPAITRASRTAAGKNCTYTSGRSGCNDDCRPAYYYLENGGKQIRVAGEYNCGGGPEGALTWQTVLGSESVLTALRTELSNNPIPGCEL